MGHKWYYRNKPNIRKAACLFLRFLLKWHFSEITFIVHRNHEKGRFIAYGTPNLLCLATDLFHLAFGTPACDWTSEWHLKRQISCWTKNYLVTQEKEFNVSCHFSLHDLGDVHLICLRFNLMSLRCVWRQKTNLV